MSANRDVALGLARFIDASPSPYHACEESARMLDAAGFVAVDERDAWAGLPEKAYVRRGGSIMAWALPEGVDAADAGFRVIGAHTDSPNLRVKPRPDSGSVGFRQVGVEIYGGVLLNSWLDRDLGLSGRLFVDADHAHEERLFHLDRPLYRVPQLAIHLDRGIHESGLKLDKQLHMAPISGVGDRKEGAFKEFLADAVGCDPAAIKSWDAMLHDLTPSRLIGADEDILAAPRLDNLCSAYLGLRALIDASDNAAPRGVAVSLFDHEEVGSGSRSGADGPLLADILERIVIARGGTREDYLRTMTRSLVISADMAHAVHPNYPEKHEPDHHVYLGAGPVIKTNANQRYATESETEAIFQAACERAGVPVQKWVMRTNMACGSTIGPLTAARTGIRTVDVGCAQLSMHSAREMCSSEDPGFMLAALRQCLIG